LVFLSAADVGAFPWPKNPFALSLSKGASAALAGKGIRQAQPERNLREINPLPFALLVERRMGRA
jgi:hypothetical protein